MVNGIMSMHFTIEKNPQIDRQILADLEIIKETLHKVIPVENFVSLFLVGGFGRGEGGVIQKQGRHRPANDYDLELITRRPLKASLLKKTGNEMAEKLAIPWVHIESNTLAKLRHLKFTMYNYDLKYASLFLEGEKEVLDAIPEMDGASMPWREAENLLFTRLWCFYGAFREDMRKRALFPEEASLLTGQISKALLAIEDTYLILAGKYHPSYLQRIKRLENTDIPRGIIPLCQWATEVKLTPEMVDRPNLLELLFMVRNHYLDTLFHLYSTAYKRRLRDWDHYAQLHFTNPYTLLKRLYFRLVKRSHWFIEYLNFNLGMIYLTDALGQKEIQEQSLRRADFYLGRIKGYQKPAKLNWTSLQEKALKLRERLWHSE